jgi:hypothetical protein
MLFLALSLLSSLLAPAHRLDALKFDTRLALGIATFWMIVDQVRSRGRLLAILWALVIASGVSALIGIGEWSGWNPIMQLLTLFKEAPTRIGSQLRVSATFQYATMAAIFFEMSVPIAVALAATAQNTILRRLALIIALLGTVIVVLTFSRAGLATLLTGLLAMLLLAWRNSDDRRLLPAGLATLGTLLLVTFSLALLGEGFRSRLLTENDLTWYGASYRVPASLRMTAGEATTVSIAVQNSGSMRWHTSGENAFALAYYWLADNGRPLDQGHVEVPLPQTVAPGATVEMTVKINAELPPGRYQVVWGMLQQRILWFRHRDIPEAYTTVIIERGSASATRLPSTPPQTSNTLPGGDMPTQPPTVARLILWSAALRMWRERPLLGVGPDNFRHLYGLYLGLPDWDRRLHANNLYLELLAGWGIAGALAFAALVWVIVRRWIALWQRARNALRIWSLALGSAFLAFFVHGFLDYFLEFVPLYLLYWIVAALIVALEKLSLDSSPARM